jgi:hypothetical protein
MEHGDKARKAEKAGKARKARKGRAEGSLLTPDTPRFGVWIVGCGFLAPCAYCPEPYASWLLTPSSVYCLV